MRNDIRKMILIFLLCLNVLVTGCTTSEPDMADVSDSDTSITVGNLGENRGTDVVLVMDESGSMATSDSNRVAIEGAKLFIDMEKKTGVNLALVQFSNVIMSTGLIDMQQQQNKDYIKSVLDTIVYGGKAHTDTGAGLLEAVSVLDGTENKNDKCIILFTDGRTDIDANARKNHGGFIE